MNTPKEYILSKICFDELTVTPKNPMHLYGNRGLEILSLVYSRVPLIRREDGIIDSFQTLKRIPDLEVNGVFWSSKQIQDSLRYLSGVPWGDAVGTRPTQSKNKEWNCFTPPFLAGHKRYNNIQYNEWDRTKLTYLVPQAVELAFKNFKEYTLGDVDIHEARDTARTNVSDGNKLEFSSYKCNPTGHLEIDLQPKLIKMMIMQLWIFNASIRNPYMILDPNDWDLMPAALDSIQLPVSSGDLPF